MLTRNKFLANQSGFTLVEIAIVLVIIGLLLGGVLKGQELIENAKVKSIVNDMKAIQGAYNGYVDRFKAIPGDDTAAAMNARGWVGTAGGNGNGVLLIPVANTFNNGVAEQQAFWRGLRASGLLTGDPTDNAATALPRHAANGLLGVTADTAGVYGQSGVYICASGLSTKQAAAIDVLVDGPLPPATQIGNNTLSLRGGTGAANPLVPTTAAPAATAYNETATVTSWTVCMKM